MVSVPMAIPIRMAETAFRNLIVAPGAIFLAALLLLDLLLYWNVVRPVRRLPAMADETGLGYFSTPELPAPRRRRDRHSRRLV